AHPRKLHSAHHADDLAGGRPDDTERIRHRRGIRPRRDAAPDWTPAFSIAPHECLVDNAGARCVAAIELRETTPFDKADPERREEIGTDRAPPRSRPLLGGRLPLILEPEGRHEVEF